MTTRQMRAEGSHWMLAEGKSRCSGVRLPAKLEPNLPGRPRVDAPLIRRRFDDVQPEATGALGVIQAWIDRLGVTGGAHLLDRGSHQVVVRRDDEADRVLWTQSAVEHSVRHDLADREPSVLESLF